MPSLPNLPTLQGFLMENIPETDQNTPFPMPGNTERYLTEIYKRQEKFLRGPVYFALIQGEFPDTKILNCAESVFLGGSAP